LFKLCLNLFKHNPIFQSPPIYVNWSLVYVSSFAGYTIQTFLIRCNCAQWPWALIPIYKIFCWILSKQFKPLYEQFGILCNHLLSIYFVYRLGYLKNSIFRRVLSTFFLNIYFLILDTFTYICYSKNKNIEKELNGFL